MGEEKEVESRTNEIDTQFSGQMQRGVMPHPLELAALRSFVVVISRGECECGVPPNDNGVHCDTCQAIIMRDTFKF